MVPKTHKFLIFCLFQLLMLITPSFSQGQNCNATTLEEFYKCYGGQSAFNAHSIAAVSTFIKAEDAIIAKDFSKAKKLIDDLFISYPVGSNTWWNVFNDPNGANIGAPHAYYGLRMMQDIVDHGLTGDSSIVAKKANLNVVLVGKSEGIQPQSEADLSNGTGTFVKHNLDPKIKEDNYRIVRQSLQLFHLYIKAITKGSLELNINFIELDELNLPVHVTKTKPHLAYKTIEPVWETLTNNAKDSTDWFWILYPSHVPEQPIFDDEAFITGGMGADSKGGPVFIIDDKWLVRKPAHLGKGNYTDIERRIYLPQWLQHEFFHHIYRIYPELKLEVNGHDWFNRSFWAADFVGQFETDYYTETLHKRVQVDCAPLATKLITRVESDQLVFFNTMAMKEFLGSYSLDKVENSWHEGNIINVNNEYFWRNKANVQWRVTPDFVNGRLVTGADCPYPGQDFFIELYKNTEGSVYPGAVGLRFNGELYKKRFDLLRRSVPLEIVVGDYERVPNQNAEHAGAIIKSEGQLKWRNKAGTEWSLTPNIEKEILLQGSNSSSPNKETPLILVDNSCAIHTLGYKCVDHYFWKPKRMKSNYAPKLIDSITDVELANNFGTYEIDLSNRFEDAEGDSIMLFVTSEASSLISAKINSKQLQLTGGPSVSTNIYLMALDPNGGLAVDEFNVVVKSISSINDNVVQHICVSPTVVHDFFSIKELTSDHIISIVSHDNKLSQVLPVSDQNSIVDISHLPAGLYFVLITNKKDNSRYIEKVVKY